MLDCHEAALGNDRNGGSAKVDPNTGMELYTLEDPWISGRVIFTKLLPFKSKEHLSQLFNCVHDFCSMTKTPLYPQRGYLLYFVSRYYLA